ncbi:Spc7-domain-containing protein [Calocera viscosa TUFC12733]|uniref:Spc7-domain-containing protein n=1 Tax=Calocera viscosa (strain TUFC12733) TaxID=1330018 RepID=A0A167K5Y7_CALVF|nr:Spc7-domain-containing protein [Calocera viscosa TUFC12733]
MATTRETRSSSRKSFPPPDLKEKENHNHKTRAKRHQSMGGAQALDGAGIPFKELVIKPAPQDMSPGKKRRRSAVPRKSILRKRDNEDQTTDFTLSAATAPLPAAESNDFTTIMNFESHTTDDRRKSLARRVSFASHAHVRLFPKEAPKVDSSSPAPSTPSTAEPPADAESPSSPSPPAAKGVSFGDVEDSPEDARPSAGPSVAPKRRSSIANAGALLGHDMDEDEEQSSMEVDDDTTNMSIHQPPNVLFTSPAPRPSLAGSITSEADMDITTAFGGVQRVQDDTAEHTASSKSSAGSEFLFPLGKNVPAANPKSHRGSEPTARDKAWQALESVTNGVNNESSDEDEDMELMDATGRVLAIRRASTMTTGSAMDLDDDDMVTGKIIQTQPGLSRLSFISQGSNMDIDDDDSRTDEEEPLDGDDADRTVNLTTMMSRMGELGEARVRQELSGDDEDSTSDPSLSEVNESEGPAVIVTSPTKTARQFSPSKGTSPLKRPTFSDNITPTKRQAVGDTPTKATLRAIPTISTPSRIFPSPLRQSPGRILRMTPSKLGSPSRVRVESPMRSPAARSPGRHVLPPVREEDGSSEDSNSSLKFRGRAALASVPSAPMPASQSQSTVQGLEDISGLMEQDEQDSDEIPLRQLSINDFLEMTGVTFMDGLAVKRRSTVGPGVLGSVRDEGLDGRTANRPLAEYVSAAAVGIPQLEMYIWACQELKKNITTSQETVHTFDDQVERSNPLLFREYMIANEEERPLMEGQLKIMKAHARLCAKEKWYQWRQGLVQDLQNTVTEHLMKLQSDYEFIQKTQAELGASLPELRARHAGLAEEVALERSNIQELEGDNPEQVKELREGIAEQNTQIESFRSELAEVATKAERLNNKIADIEEQRKQQMSITSKAEQHCTMLLRCSRSEVFRLKEDFESLQRMHLWTPEKVKAAETILVYDSRIQVTLRPEQKTLGIDSLRLLSGPDGEDELIREAIEGLFLLMRDGLKSLSTRDHPEVVRVVSNAWTAATHLLAEIRLLYQKYPISVSVPGSELGSELGISVLLMLQESKTDLTFTVDSATLMDWPSSAPTVNCKGNLIYGDADIDSLVHAARERIQQATPDQFYGYLVDACREAISSQE